MSLDCVWKPESIRVFAGEGKPFIDIVGYLKDQNHPQFELMRCRKRLEFPSDIYPPNEASRSIIEDAIIHAAATVDVNLTRQGIERKKKGLAIILGCDMRRTTYFAKKSSDVQKRVYENMDSGEQLSVKEGIKHDNCINRAAEQRPNGKKGTRRTYTTKPAPHQTCSFNVRICLDPGRCWYLSPWAGNAYHNHKKLGAGKKRRRVVTLSHDEVIYETSPSEEDDTGTETFLSQDVGVSQSGPSLVNAIEDSVTSTQNSNFYDSSMAKLNGILDTCKTCNDPELECFLNTELNALVGRFQERMIEKVGHDRSLTGGSVSFSVPVDRRQKCNGNRSKRTYTQNNATA